MQNPFYLPDGTRYYRGLSEWEYVSVPRLNLSQVPPRTRASIPATARPIIRREDAGTPRLFRLTPRATSPLLSTRRVSHTTGRARDDDPNQDRRTQPTRSHILTTNVFDSPVLRRQSLDSIDNVYIIARPPLDLGSLELQLSVERSCGRRRHHHVDEDSVTTALPTFCTPATSEITAIREEFSRRVEAEERRQEAAARAAAEAAAKEAAEAAAKEAAKEAAEAAAKEAAKEAEERKKREEDEQKMRDAAAKEAEEKKLAEERRLAEVSKPDDEAKRKAAVQLPLLDLAKEWEIYLDGEFKQMSQEPSLKEFRLSVKRAANLGVNQIASSITQVTNVHQKIYALASQYFGDMPRLRYIAATVLEALIDGAETQVIANIKSAWAYAKAAALLRDSIPHFGEWAEAAFAARCPYVLPFYATKTKEMSMSEFERSRKQRIGESELDYFRRQSSILRLYLAYHVSMQDYACIWRWWAIYVNTRPKRISAELLDVALEVSGAYALAIFGHQFNKIIIAVLATIVPKLHALQTKDTTGLLAASTSRVRTKLEQYYSSRQMPYPVGYDMPNSETTDTTAASVY